MSGPLDAVIDDLAGERRELVAVSQADDPSLDAVVDYFDRFNLSEVTRVDDPALPAGALLVTDGERCLAAVDINDLHAYLFDPAIRGGAFADDQSVFDSGAGTEGASPTDDTTTADGAAGTGEYRSLTDADLAGIRQFLARLDNRVYTVTKEHRTPMVAVSRQIEQQAFAAGEGAIHAGFQRLSRLRDRRHTLDTYRTLAEPGVDVSVYGVPDWIPSAIDGVTVYGDDDGDVVGDYWFVVVDNDRGGGALVAREDEPGTYTGFWTFRPSLVADVVETIERDVQSELRRVGE